VVEGGLFDVSAACLVVTRLTMIDLSAPIDVYSDWIDAADAVARGATQEDEDYDEIEA
jgi:transcription elongation factor Elf1